jgi:hypothetical protein
VKIQVTFEIDDEDGDPENELGLTTEQFEKLIRDVPGYDVEIERLS